MVWKRVERAWNAVIFVSCVMPEVSSVCVVVACLFVMHMLNVRVKYMTPATMRRAVFSIVCSHVCFASLDVVCNELIDDVRYVGVYEFMYIMYIHDAKCIAYVKYYIDCTCE